MATARLLTLVLTLAILDLAAGVSLKEAALRRSPALALLGVALLVALGIVFFFALEGASLTMVNLGWIVLLQAAVLVVDHVKYGVTPSRIQASAILVALIALIVAALAPTPEPEPVAKVPAQREPGPLETELRRRVAERNAFFDLR